MIAAAACATGPRPIMTPQGERAADQNGPFVILGVISRATSTLHRSNADTPFEETVTLNVPVGTQLIIPALRGYGIGYGSTTPEDLSPDPGPAGTAVWHSTDHHLGVASVNIWVDRVNAVDNSSTPATQTAVIKVRAWLTDDNHDDAWWALATYTLLCLGPLPARE
jgi:hypothetical protein